MTKKWNKKKEERYEDICLGEDYDEEYCYDFVTREDDSVDDENEVLEILLDAKRLTDLLSQELNNYIIRVTKG
ncbi:hypothetical protein [Sulfolobus spindle-shaped virus]|nr:hypothetical protein [Sulfolobus spindle-shaped virus]AZG03618.1 hypothetical protein [Sulfolobus spindle-shaped virus]AZG03651.1 hypothetical protein [Sulfolobus spindle-shaped virus]AZG03674.1 hypothetical protein [Sulfolobus spindle-shaped virus]AZG03722.1 hypothetical protein [Sulfolobus spindle-shaped virus]